MGKTSKVPSAVQKDKDESIVFFRELYKHEKDTDVNLLEPIYSVEFDAIQGGHMSKPPPGKRDLLIPINEKQDYDWPKTPPVAPMFPSLKMEANSSESQPVKKPSASRLIGKTQATKTSAKPASPPTGSLLSKNLFRGAPSISNHAVDKRSACVNRQQKPDAATAKHTPGASSKAHSNMYYASASTANTVESPADVPYTAPKNLLTTGRPRSRGPPLGVKSGGARRPPCPPAAVARGTKELQLDGSRKNDLPAKGKAVASTSTIKTLPTKGMLRRADGKNDRRPRFADQ